MERTNFEKLQVYKLSEGLSDSIWDVVLGWHYIAPRYDWQTNRNLLTRHQINNLTPIIAELTPKLNAYLRSVKKAASDKAKRSTKDKALSSET